MNTTNKNHSNYLLIGHGIAGALLGYFLEKNGASVTYIDAPQQTSATQVAAGIINPITGRRYVKSWRIEELLPFAQQTYQRIEEELGIQLYHPRPLIRTLFNRGEENDWYARKLDPDYADYHQATVELGSIPAWSNPAFSYLQIAKAAQVNIALLESTWRKQRVESGQLHEQDFAFADLDVHEKGIRYNDFRADRIVFCEGWRSRFNPFFNYLPFKGNKGEILLIRIAGVRLERLFKHRIFIVPYMDNLYWVGATSDNNFQDDQPSEEGLSFLRSRLDELLTVSYEVVAHKAAVRPTIRDRRPLLGQHPDYSQVYLFNGMGTKGASLAPYWAHHFADYLLNNRPLDPQVDIQRVRGDL